MMQDAHGTLTAVVVGTDDPTHTDRDLRVRVQLKWIPESRQKLTEFKLSLSLPDVN